MTYSECEDYCKTAEKWQSVPSADSCRALLEAESRDTDAAAVLKYRKERKYSCADSYQPGMIRDDHIYVSVTDRQHEQIIRGEHPTADGGISGYFTDQATVDDCITGGILDNGRLNREMQVAPYQADKRLPAAYKAHLECFIIDHEKMESIYGTGAFSAALSKCEANNQFGEGGGNQGFRPELSELMSNGCLKFDRRRSFSDPSVSRSSAELQNEGVMTNSIVGQGEYKRMMYHAQTRTADCVAHDTEHPSQAVTDATGCEHNPSPVPGITGNGVLMKDIREQQGTEKQKGENGSIRHQETGEQHTEGTGTLRLSDYKKLIEERKKESATGIKKAEGLVRKDDLSR